MTRTVLLSAAFIVGLVVQGAARDLPLHEAVKAGDLSAVRGLVEDSVDVNTVSADGSTALHWAAHHNRVEIASALLVAGAEVDAINRYGVNPLALASLNGSVPMLSRLLEAGARRFLLH